MSFILDALKKSENERQKQAGPALFEVKVAPPPRRFPAWAVVVGVLLGVNLMVLIAVLLMRDRQDPAVQATQAARAVPMATGGDPNARPMASAPSAPAPAPAPAAGASLPASTNPTGGATLGPDGLPIATGAVQAPASAAGPPTRFNPPLVEEDPTAYDEPPANTRGTPVNPADYTPATAGPPPAAAPMPQPSGYPLTAGSGPNAPPGRASGSVRTTSAIPSRDDLMASGKGDIPPASVGLHVYDPNPAARFVFVNGIRAREGDVLPNGLRVDEIGAEGTVLSFRGARFLVPIQ
jgi:general secretion pathway protein B